MKTTLKGHSLDWALIHICRYCDSDLFPRMFEFNVIRWNWSEVKERMLAVNMETYEPRPPQIRFAPKLTGAQRIVHRLDPIDSLIYTAMVYEIHEAMEKTRKPESPVPATLLIHTDSDGSFFQTARDAWQQHTARIERLARSYPDGHVLMADIFDFFGQIQPRRLAGVLAEVPGCNAKLARNLIHFLYALCPASGRGIPIGPAASTVLSEVIMESIERRIVASTSDFARWGDDLRVFFSTREEAQKALGEWSSYLHTTYEMIFALDKTRVIPVPEFMGRHFRGLPEETVAAGPAEARLSRAVGDGSGIIPHHYAWGTSAVPETRPASVYRLLQSLPEFETTAAVYLHHFHKALAGRPPDMLTVKRIMRKAAAYRIRSILPGVLEHFDRLMPVIREAGTYLRAVLDDEEVSSHAVPLRRIWESSLQGSSYFHDWMCHVMTHPGFNQIRLPEDYSSVVGIRNQALIALRRHDIDWVHRHVAHMETMDPWDRHAVLHSCAMLPEGERERVAGAALAAGDLVELSLARHLQSLSSRKTSPGGGRSDIKGPDNYPSYGDKPA